MQNCVAWFIRSTWINKPRILSLFPYSFNKFNKTWTTMLGPLYLKQEEHSCKFLYFFTLSISSCYFFVLHFSQLSTQLTARIYSY